MSESIADKVEMRIDKIDKDIQSLTASMNKLPSRVVEAGAMQAAWALASLMLILIILSLSVGVILWGVLQDNKIEVHEAWLIGLVFTGLSAIAIMLANTLKRRDD